MVVGDLADVDPRFYDERAHVLPLTAASAQEAADWVAACGRFEVNDPGDGEPGDACPTCLSGEAGCG
eukprot:4338064-Alexandrium_andersonii.AAC.1